MTSQRQPALDSGPQPVPRPERPDWSTSIVLGVLALVAYLANDREIGSYDTEAATVMAVGLVRGDGVYLDRLSRAWVVRPGEEPPYFFRASRGHVVSRYPVAPALLAAPLMAVQVAILDRREPGWDSDSRTFWKHVPAMAKRAAALIAALTAVVLHRTLRAIGLGRGGVAIPAVLAASLGSGLWAVASQALWQHGPAALALATATWLLAARDPGRGRLALAGLAAAVLVACRATDVVFAAAMLGHVARTRRSGLAWFLPAPILGAAALIGYNTWFFGSISGGMTELEAMHPKIHGLPAGPWSGDLPGGLAGTLFSPSRGLFVYCPWAVLALMLWPVSRRRLAPWPVVGWLVAALVPFGLMLAKYTVWWGGHCFGPRYWIDATPLLAILLASGLDWSRERLRPLAWAILLAIAASIAVQAIGAFRYPSSWNVRPTDIDRDHLRLWDWNDTELRRCLFERKR